MEIRAIEVDELQRLVDVVNAVSQDANATPAEFVDWRRQAGDMVWLLAQDGDVVLGAGVGVVGWHARPGVAWVEAWTLPQHRGRGVGFELYRALMIWAGERGCIELETAVREDDPGSLAWAEHHGFREIGRTSRLVLKLGEVAPPLVNAPAGIEIVQWSTRAGLEPGMYRVFCEASPDVPGEEHNVLPTQEQWLVNDMSGVSDLPDAVFVALSGGEVVGFAKLAIPPSGRDAYHDLTGVLRAWRGRGIAGALKRAQIAWAKESGYRRLITANEERNTPIRRLNEQHGYVREPGRVTLHTMIDAAE